MHLIAFCRAYWNTVPARLAQQPEHTTTKVAAAAIDDQVPGRVRSQLCPIQGIVCFTTITQQSHWTLVCLLFLIIASDKTLMSCAAAAQHMACL